MAARRVRLAQQRKAAGYSQEQLADLLGVERSTIGRWETASTAPQPWLRPKLAQALKVTPDQLEALLDDITVTTTEPSERLSHALEHPSHVDLVAAAQLHEQLRELDGQYDQVPSAALLGPAGQVHGHVRLLRQNAWDNRVRRALWEVEAAAATFVSLLIWDVGQRRYHTASLSYLDEAVMAARQARDPATEAYAMLRKSFIALYGQRDPAQGVRYAEEACAIARLASASLTGLAWLHVAEGHALMHDLPACESALTHAERQFDQLDPDDVGAEFYTMSEFNRMAGSCYLALDLPQRAEPILRDAAAALATRQKSQAIVLGNLTLSLIHQDKRNEARAAMHSAIDAVELTRGGGGLNVAFAAGRELRQWQREPWVHEVHDRLLALMAAI